ncbi:MAG: PmoA family protein [Acidobacteria bacterium]|nr:PmoA family protein [Acidobacteriota bacterium]
MSTSGRGWIFSWLLFCIAGSVWAENGRFAFQEISPGSLQLTDQGHPVLVYNHGMMLKPGAPETLRRSGYFHPVYAPDGTVVTDDFPSDHYHHRGISWMWPVVRIAGNTYDLWHLKGIRQQFVRWTAREANGRYARLAVENGWYTDEGRVLRETVEMRTHPVEGNWRKLDFTLVFDSLVPKVEIAGTPEEQKGYGGFCMRFAPREQTTICTEAGLEATDSLMVRHPWAELRALFQSRRAGARIEIDSSNPESPNGWILRHYGLLGVNFPGLRACTLQRGRPLVLKYRVMVFSEPQIGPARQSALGCSSRQGKL